MNENVSVRIDYFKGVWGFLSNFHPAVVVYEGVEYASVEHAYQAAKTLDLKKREVLSLAFNPRLTAAKAKAIGRRIKIRPDWEEIKVGVMRELLIQKFSQPMLRLQLLSTGSAELVEGNWWHDTFWGVCQSTITGWSCSYSPHEPFGDNWLGRLLMEAREFVSTLLLPASSVSLPTPENLLFEQPE